MARIRSVHFDCWKSDKLAQASAEAERCYWRLLPACDDEGRAEDDPVVLAATLFARREDILGVHVNAWLAELAAVGLIRRYVSGGRTYLSVTRWSDFQHPQHARASIIPPPEPDSTPHEAARKPHEDDVPGVGVGEGVGEPSSSSDSGKESPQAVDDEVEEALRLYVDRKLAATPGVKSPVPWKRKTLENARTELGVQAVRWLRDFDVRPTEVADALVAGQASRTWMRRR